MKVLFSVYNEDWETGDTTFLDSRLVNTTWDIEKIEKHFCIPDGFREEIIWGQELSFFDIYCFHDVSDSYIQKIKEIPDEEEKESRKRKPIFIRIEETDSDISELISSHKSKKLFFCVIDRYEYGASGYSVIAHWMASNPVFVNIIAGAIWDFIKYILIKSFNILFHREQGVYGKKPIILCTGKFYKNFEKCTKVRAADCQIIKMKPNNKGLYYIVVRTQENDYYKVRCYINGKILSLELYRSYGSNNVSVSKGRKC